MGFLSQKDKKECEEKLPDLNWEYYDRIYVLPRDKILLELLQKNQSHLLPPTLDQSHLLRGACWRFFAGMDLDRKEIWIIKTYMIDFTSSIFAIGPLSLQKHNDKVLRVLKRMELNLNALNEMIKLLLENNIDPF